MDNNPFLTKYMFLKEEEKQKKTCKIMNQLIGFEAYLYIYFFLLLVLSIISVVSIICPLFTFTFFFLFYLCAIIHSKGIKK
jgi:hypothetical protein